MLTWFKMLRDAPAMQQRLIARFNRISLPRTCSADVRLERLRESLIHKRTVQAWGMQNAECRMQNAGQMRNGEWRCSCAVAHMVA